MKTFCVPSHHSIYPDPLNHQGVLLTKDMLEKGIWFAHSGESASHKNSYERSVELKRSENQAEYTAALAALMSISADHLCIAVISIRWCSLTYRLVTAKRVWLKIYQDKRELVAYDNKKDGRSAYNFCERWEAPERSRIVWKARFQNDIFAAL